MPYKHISIARLELTNFKKFYGAHPIDLLSRPDLGKPIVLIGGDNGRGKTSIHEAIYYALYEDDDLPNINTRPNYLRAVSDRLNHRALDEGKTDYGVAIDLLVKESAADRHIRIERKWKVNIPERKVVDLTLKIYENERPIDWIEDDPSAYREFLRSLLPPKIAPFFLFDGERIQQFADDDNREPRMIEAIEDILHINVYKLLRNDLKHYVIDHMEKSEVKKYQNDQFFELQGDKERLGNALDEKRERIADIDREIESLSRDQRQIEEELRRIASPHASERDELIAEESRLNRELDEAKNHTQKCFEPLPILLSGKNLRYSLRKQLEDEQRGLKSPDQREGLSNQIEKIKHRTFISPSPAPPKEVELTEGQIDFYVQRYDEATNEVFALNNDQTLILLHDVGEASRRQIMERLLAVEKQTVILKEAIDRCESLNNELREVRIKLQSTSDDPHVGELLQRKRAIDENVGGLKEEKKTITAEIQRLEADLAARCGQIEERQAWRKATSQAKQTIRLAQEARRVLDDFIKEIAPEKLTILKQHMEEMYLRLRKPEDPVRSLDVDQETWQIILKDEKGRPLEKRVFSQGMKEMYALSLLWALSRASGRELPIVIDTPVGRLDTTNRRSLFEKYLPFAGHQVIVLSTDTEVDKEWARRLAPYVANQYRLDYESSTNSIVIRTGYFF